MSIAIELDKFIKENADQVFIELEAKKSKVISFCNEYNNKYGENIDCYSDGIISLDESADKWAKEFRLYLNYKPSIDGIKVTRNTVYRGEYPYRINNNQLIMEMFELGYRIGINK